MPGRPLNCGPLTYERERVLWEVLERAVGSGAAFVMVGSEGLVDLGEKLGTVE